MTAVNIQTILNKRNIFKGINIMELKKPLKNLLKI